MRAKEMGTNVAVADERDGAASSATPPPDDAAEWDIMRKQSGDVSREESKIVTPASPSPASGEERLTKAFETTAGAAM